MVGQSHVDGTEVAERILEGYTATILQKRSENRQNLNLRERRYT